MEERWPKIIQNDGLSRFPASPKKIGIFSVFEESKRKYSQKIETLISDELQEIIKVLEIFLLLEQIQDKK